MKTVAPGILASLESQLKEAIGEPRYKMWVQGHTKWGLDGETLSVGVPNRFFRDWLDNNFREAIQASASKVFGTSIVVRFRIDPELFRQHQADVARAPEPAERAEPPAAIPVRRLPSRFALSRFVVGPQNRVAYAAICTLVEEPHKGYSPLLIFGPAGLGKTHLAKAVEVECQRRHPHLRLVCLTGEEFTNEFIEAMKTHRLSAFRKRIRSADVLVVDDVQFLAGKRATQEEFLHALRSIEMRGAKAVLTCMDHPRKIAQLSEELRSRFISGMVTRLDPLDRQMRRQVVLDKSVGRKLELDPDVVDFLAEHLKSSVNEIEGALNYLEHYAETFGAKMTLEATRTALADVLRHSVPMIRVEDVRRRVCEIFNIHPKTLRLRSRTRAVSHPRMLALYLARKYTTATYSEIGREIGGLNHSSVISAEHRIQDELRKDGELVLGEKSWKVRDAIEEFERALGRA